jgi:hypothetical protein
MGRNSSQLIIIIFQLSLFHLLQPCEVLYFILNFIRVALFFEKLVNECWKLFASFYSFSNIHPQSLWQISSSHFHLILTKSSQSSSLEVRFFEIFHLSSSVKMSSEVETMGNGDWHWRKLNIMTWFLPQFVTKKFCVVCCVAVFCVRSNEPDLTLINWINFSCQFLAVLAISSHIRLLFVCCFFIRFNWAFFSFTIKHIDINIIMSK